MMARRVLLVDDDAAVREAVGQTLELADCTPVLAASFVVAKDHITPDFEGVVISDVRMPGRDGFHLLDYAQSIDVDLPVILLTGQADIPMAVDAMGRGAFSFLEKPCAPATLMAGVEKALIAREDVLRHRRLKDNRESSDAASRLLFGTSDVSKNLRARVRHVARAGAEVLVEGEPGSGTAKVAEVIHLLSAQARQPFVKRAASGLDASALSDALAKARAGTLYLDEISTLSTNVQFALLDVIESGAVARIIVGTTTPLTDVVAAGQFSADLHLRLDALRVRIPPLRERIEDVPILFRQYLAQACEQANLPVPDVTPDLIDRLMTKDWPGNARALMNTAMRFAMGLEDLDELADLTLPQQMARIERSLLIAALRRAGGRAGDTAKALGLPRKTFYDKLAKHGLRAEDYRTDGAD